MNKKKKRNIRKRHARRHQVAVTEDLFEDEGVGKPDWTRKCIVCEATPIVPETEMCGPCTFGEASTVNGNW